MHAKHLSEKMNNENNIDILSYLYLIKNKYYHKNKHI